MAWTATFTKDMDKSDVGTMSAVFTYADGTVFNFSERIVADAAVGQKQFYSDALAAKAAYEAALADNQQIAAQMTKLLNS